MKTRRPAQQAQPGSEKDPAMSKLVIVLSALLLAGCVTAKNTPRQDYAGAMPATPGPPETTKTEPAERAQPA